MRMLDQIDLSLLDYCRDPDCDRVELHAAHGAVARTVKASKHDRDLALACVECGTPWVLDADSCVYCHARESAPRAGVRPRYSYSGCNNVLVDVVYNHVGSYVPTSFTELYWAVVEDYGTVTTRSVRRALRYLITIRRIVALANPWLPRRVQRSPRCPPIGFYVRFDSPKLWAPNGLEDLRSVAVDCSLDPSDTGIASM